MLDCLPETGVFTAPLRPLVRETASTVLLQMARSKAVREDQPHSPADPHLDGPTVCRETNPPSKHHSGEEMLSRPTGAGVRGLTVRSFKRHLHSPIPPF